MLKKCLDYFDYIIIYNKNKFKKTNGLIKMRVDFINLINTNYIYLKEKPLNLVLKEHSF